MVPGVPKMVPARCFLLVLEVIKWPSEIHPIFRKVYIFLDMVVCPFSEGAFGEILASIRCPKTPIYFRSGSCFEHSGAQLNMSHPDSINNRTVKFVFFLLCCLQTVKVSTILVSVKSTGSWLHAGTYPLFVH